MGRKGGETKTGGRKKGTPNRITPELVRVQRLVARDIAEGLVSDETYLQKLADRLREGTLSPQIEQMVWQYAFGKPPDTLRIQGDAEHPLTFKLEQAHKQLTEIRHARIAS